MEIIIHSLEKNTQHEKHINTMWREWDVNLSVGVITVMDQQQYFNEKSCLRYNVKTQHN